MKPAFLREAAILACSQVIIEGGSLWRRARRAIRVLTEPIGRPLPTVSTSRGARLAWGVVMQGYGPWKVAGSPVMARALTNGRLEQLGFSSLYRRYLALGSS